MIAQTERSFAAMLRRAREAADMSQGSLSRATHLSAGLISRLESGQRMPSAETVETLIRALHLTHEQADDLRVSAGFRAHSPTYGISNDPDFLELCRLLKNPQIPAEKKATLLRTVRQVARLIAAVAPALAAAAWALDYLN